MTDDDLFGGLINSTREAADRERAYEQDRRARKVFAEIERSVCELCDASGYRPNGIVCDHVDRSETVRRGMALIRDVLKLAELKRRADPRTEEPL